MMTQLNPQRLVRSEYVCTPYNIKAEVGTPYAVVLLPSYWAHVSAQMRLDDIIYIQPEDRTWWAMLLVTGVGKLYANVEEIVFLHRKSGAQKLDLQVPEGYDVAFRGEQGKWGVTIGKGKDKQVIKDGFETQEQATLLAIDHYAITTGAKAA